MSAYSIMSRVSMSVVWVLLLLLYLEMSAARRSCPPGRFCRINANCTSNTTSCVVQCPTENDTMQQGNHTTGNCERLPKGTYYWMDSTFYEVFVLSDQAVNTPIINISFISSQNFRTNDYTYSDLVEDITFTLNGSCPYFYFANMSKQDVVFENYYDFYIPNVIEHVTLLLAESVPLDDYEMHVIVTDGGNVLERRDILVHVRDVPPCTTSPNICVEFSSANLSVLRTNDSLMVTLISSGNTLSESFIIGVIAEADNSSKSPATGRSDFSPGRYNATFTPGAATATVNIPILDDDNGDEIEQFSLRLFIDGAAYQQCIFSGSVSTATVSIIPIPAIVGFTSGQFVGSESSGLIEVIVRITGGSSSTPITVTVTPSVQSPVSAMGSGVDFNSSSFTITINAGATEGRANVSVTCDDEVEGLETFDMTLTLTSSSSNVMLGRNTSEGYINDSTVELSFSQSSHEVMEDDGRVTLMIRLSQVSSVSFQVTVNVTAVEDHIQQMMVVTVTAGVMTQSFTVPIVYNNIVECNKTFIVTMLSVATCGVTIGNNNRSEVRIADDDGATVSLSQSQYSVMESNNSLTGTITLSSRASEDVILEVTISDGSANAGVDYAMSSALVFNVTISAGSTSLSFSIDIINDVIQENNETFNIAIRLLPSCLSLSLGTSSSTVMITDDDLAKITFSSSTFDGSESSGIVSATIIISGGVVSSKDINIPVSFTPGSAVGNDIDFYSAPQTITITAGTNSSTINITVIKDNIVEGNEAFNMSLTVPSSLGPGITTGNITSATATIIDTSNVTVRFTQDQFTGSETAGFVLVTLELTGGKSAFPFSVTVTPLEQSPVSAKGGVDFNTTTLTATFASGMTMSNVSVPVIVDKVVEEQEEFDLRLDVPSSLGPAITAGSRVTATGVIAENMTIVGFTSGQFVGLESSGFIEVIVRITGGLSSTPITVTVTPSVQSPVSAMGSGVDFNSNPFTITINAGATEGRANVSVTCDDEVEGLETFDMTLTLTSSSSRVMLGRDTCEGQIGDSTVMVNFNQSLYGVKEDDSTVTITMILSQPSSVQFQVIISATDFTAIDGEDYTGNSMTVNIPAGVTTQPLTINIINNNIVECDETFNVTIMSVTTCGITIGSNNISEVMITDYGATVSLSQSQYSVVESNNSLTGTITLNSTLSKDVIVEVTISDGSANAGVDYAMSSALVFNVTISAGLISSSFSINIINDTMQEDNETFNIAIRLLPSCLPLSLGISSSTIKIIDDDRLMVEFSSQEFTGYEQSGVISVTLVLKGGVSDDSISVTVISSDQSPVSAQGNGVDYISTPITATFPAGSSSTTINVSVTRDIISEDSETFDLRFTIPSSLKAVVSGNIDRAVGRIDDNTTITVNFSQRAYNINESNGRLQPMLFFSNPSSIDITLQVEDASNTAIGGVDYNSGPYDVTFHVGETNASFDVSIINDNLLERNENFTLTITMVNSLSRKVTTTNAIAQTTVNIIDNDIATISFDQSEYSIVEENKPFKPLLVLSNPSSYVITIQVESISGNASGNDYTSGPYNVKFLAGSTSIPFDVPITNDDVLENNETFSLNIISSSVPDQVIIGNPRQSTVTIIDNDILTVRFSSSNFTASESSGNIPVTLLLEGGTSSSDISVTVLPSDQSPVSAKGGVDYTSTPITATFPAGTNSTTINIPVTKDIISEDNLETFDLILTIPPSLKSVFPGSISRTIGSIIDNTTITVSFSQVAYNINESDGRIQPILHFSNPSSSDITLQVEDTSNTAIGGIDYNSGPYDVMFAAGVTSVSFDIIINDDNIIETNENITLSIAVNSLPRKVTTNVNIAQTTVTITDNDTATISFSQSQYSIVEGNEPLKPLLLLSNPSSYAITIQVESINGNASGNNTDYDSGPYNVTFPAESTNIPFDVNITNDNILESNETFSLNIISSSAPDRVTINSLRQSGMTIIDNDTLTVQFSSSTFTASESSGNISVTVMLEGGTSFTDINVIVIPSDQSPVSAASSGNRSDYVASNITATIIAGNTGTKIYIPITNDSHVEELETFNLNIAIPSSLPPSLGGRLSAGGITTAIGRIFDRSVLVIELASTTFTGSESSKLVNAVVTKSNALTVAIVTVQLTFTKHSSMSATGSVDFDSSSMTVELPPMEIATTIPIPVVCDRLTEGTEMFEINLEILSATHNVTTGLGLNKSIGIIEDSTVDVKFDQLTYIIREDAISLSPVIVLSQPSPETLTLNVNLGDINTTAGADYNQQNVPVTIDPGTTRQPFTINIINDNIIECTEAFSLSIEGTWCGLNSSDGRAQVIIIDDDVGVVNIVRPQLLVKEAIGSFEVHMMLNATTSQGFALLSTIAGETASVGSDFTHTRSSQLTSLVNIASGSLSGSTSISIVNDTVQEYNETFDLTLQLQSACLPIILIGENFFNFTIIDDEELTVEFSQVTYSGTESSDVIIITLTLYGGTASFDFNINVSTSPLTATGGVDFNDAILTTTFVAGSTTANVIISIADDAVVDEKNETVNLTFNLVPTEGVRVKPGTRDNAVASATAIIIDTTPPQMYLHPADQFIRINNDSTSVAFVCIANGSRSYFWQRDDGNSIPSDAEGIKSNNLVLNKILPHDSGRYRCVAENKHGRNYSRYAVLTVEAIPPVVTIIVTTEGVTGTEGGIQVAVKKGERAEFMCIATGLGFSDFEYQWFLNNIPVDGQENPNLVIRSVSETNTGDYSCSVLNPYKGIGRSNITATLILDLSCNPATISYSGFNVTWNETKVGVTAVAPCTGAGLAGNVTRRCIIDDEWDEIVNCFNEQTGILRDQAENLTMALSQLNETEAIKEAGNIANSLVNVTAPKESSPIFAADIDLAVNIVSTLNNVTETVVANLTVDDTFFDDTTSVLNNLLSDTNQDSWQQLERTSPSTSQALVSGAEQVTKILSATLTDDTTEAIKAKPNIVLKAERISNDSLSKGYKFPDEDDNLTEYTGSSAQLSVSADLLQDLTINSSQQLTIASTVIRDSSGFRLPSTDNETATPQVPASPIFSLQIDPPPDPEILANNPIMMMFDVVLPSSLDEELSVEDSVQNQPDFGVQNHNFDLDDVTCTFYDYSLITNNLNQLGGWSNEGLDLDTNHSNRTSVSCLTTHLTSFAVLVSIQDERPPSSADKALSIISYIGCSISLVCLCLSILFLAYTILKSRDKINHLFIHLNLCIALALGLVVFIAGIESATSNEVICKFVAALLQYLFISAFCWMLCEGVMLYMMLVTVFGNKLNKRRFFFLLGWGPALPIVAISAGIAYEHYGTDHYCWIKSDDGAIAAFIVPIVAIMLINCVFFGITMKVLWDSQQKVQSEKANANVETVKDLMKAVIVLLPLLGLTWIIGILAVNNDTQVFAWIFAILNSLQGVFIFIFHVMRNKQVAKELSERYTFMRNSIVFRRIFTSTRGSGSTSTLGITSKARASQSTSSEVSGRSKKISTTSFGSTGGDYFSTTLERRYSKDKTEANEDDSVFEDTAQIKLTTFLKLDQSIIEEHEIGVEEKQPILDNRDIEEEDRKSITEGDFMEDNKPTTEKGVEEKKKSDTKEEKESKANAAGTIERNGAKATIKPTPLPRTIK